MGHSSWWPVNLTRLHHGHLVNNKPQLQAPIKGSGSVSSPHDDGDDYHHHHHHHHHHHNHNKIFLSDWLSAALITALIRQCYRTVSVIVLSHFYDLFFSLLAKTLTQTCLLIWSYQKINVVIVMINISDRTLPRPIWSLIILIIKQIQLQLSRHPILLISRKIQGYY